MNVAYLKEKLHYLSSIQAQYRKNPLIQYQISFIHSCLEFHYNNEINVHHLGVYSSNNNLNYLIEEMPSAKMQRFVRSIRNKAFTINVWNKFTTSKYRRGIDPEDDIAIAINNEMLLDIVSKMNSVRELSLHIIDNDTFVQESTLDDGSTKFSLIIRGTSIKIDDVQLNNLIKAVVLTYRYIRTYITGSLNIIGYDKSTLIFQYEVHSKHMTYYSKDNLTPSVPEVAKKNSDEDACVNHDDIAKPKPKIMPWLFKKKDKSK